MSENYKKNDLSDQPGHDVTLVYECREGEFTVMESKSYDWVQMPYVYIRSVLKKDTTDKKLYEAWVNGELKWRRSDPNVPWKF
jgi:hypothetical protein